MKPKARPPVRLSGTIFQFVKLFPLCGEIADARAVDYNFQKPHLCYRVEISERVGIAKLTVYLVNFPICVPVNTDFNIERVAPNSCGIGHFRMLYMSPLKL